MKIVVCVKQVPDPEAPASAFKVDAATNRVVPPPGIPPVMNGFDEQAVEAALRIKDKNSAQVVVLSVGPEGAREVIKKALAMGGDEGFLVNDPALEDSDAHGIAYALAESIKKIGGCDLVLSGRQASDWDQAQVPAGVAELLGLPCVTLAKTVSVEDSAVRVQRVLPDGYEVWTAPLPAVITVSNELGEPRYATLKGIMAAARKKVTVWSAADLALDKSRIGVAGRRVLVRKLFIPVKEGKCEVMEGDTVGAKASALARKLREAKLI